jgi:hypothetical protein
MAGSAPRLLGGGIGRLWWQGHIDVASSHLLREMNDVEMSMEVRSAVEAGQRSGYGG